MNKFARVLLIVVAVLPLFFVAKAHPAVNIYDWSTLKTYYTASTSQDLLIMDDLKDGPSLGGAGGWSQLAIIGYGVIKKLDGDRRFSAVDLTNQNFSVSNISFNNFIRDTGDNGGAMLSRITVPHDPPQFPTINLNNSVDFVNNSVQASGGNGGSGGAVGTQGLRRVVFGQGSNVRFIQNTAEVGGGALFIMEGSRVESAAGAAVIFVSNTAKNGGAFYIENSTASFVNSNITFSSNVAVSSGGAVYAADGSQLIFDTSNTRFSSNTAQSGGAFYMEEKAVVAFSNGSVDFIGNTANGNGGVFFMSGGSTITFNSDVRFSGNSAGGLGGAIYAAANTTNTIIISQSVHFEGNSSANGAAENDIYIDERAMLILNTSGSALLDINIYIDKGATLILNTSGSALLDINSGIGGDQSSTLKKDGPGTLSLSGAVSFVGKLLIENGEVLIPQPKQGLTLGKIEISTNGTLNHDSITKIETGDIDVWGSLKVWINQTDKTTGVLKSSGSLTFEPGSSLIVKSYGSGSGSVLLMTADSGITLDDVKTIRLVGEGNVKRFEIINKGGPAELWIQYDLGIRDIILNLTPNQQAVYDILNGDSSENNNALIALITPISGVNDRNAKKMLDELSGSFILTSLKAILMDNTDAVLYSKINDIRSQSSINYRGVWGEIYFDGYSIKDEDNTMEEFNEDGFSALGGVNMIKTKSAIGGIFAQYWQKGLQQGSADGAAKGVDVGGYASYDMPIKNKIINLKAAASLGLGVVNTARQASIGHVNENGELFIKRKTTQAKFNVYTMKYLLNAEYAFDPTPKNQIIFKPFVDLRLGFLFNENIKETGGDEINLTVPADSYSRIEAMLGTRIGKQKDLYRWEGKIGFGYLLLGSEGKFDVKINSISTEYMQIVADKESPFFVKLGGYGEYTVYKDVDVFAEGDIKNSNNSFGYYIGIGAKYRFTVAIQKRVKRPRAKQSASTATAATVSGGTIVYTGAVPEIYDGGQGGLGIQELTLATLRGQIFINNEEELTPEAKTYIRNLASSIREREKSYKSVEIVVEGFADWSEPDNQNLALKRARVAAQELAKYGFRVKYKGNPMVKQPKDYPAGYVREAFRKVEFKTTMTK